MASAALHLSSTIAGLAGGPPAFAAHIPAQCPLWTRPPVLLKESAALPDIPHGASPTGTPAVQAPGDQSSAVLQHSPPGPAWTLSLVSWKAR